MKKFYIFYLFKSNILIIILIAMDCISVKTNEVCTHETTKSGCFCLFPQAGSDFENFLV